MTEPEPLIPRPPIVREQLARNLRERRVLRSLLNLSLKVASDDLLATPRETRLMEGLASVKPGGER